MSTRKRKEDHCSGWGFPEVWLTKEELSAPINMNNVRDVEVRCGSDIFESLGLMNEGGCQIFSGYAISKTPDLYKEIMDMVVGDSFEMFHYRHMLVDKYGEDIGLDKFDDIVKSMLDLTTYHKEQLNIFTISAMEHYKL